MTQIGLALPACKAEGTANFEFVAFCLKVKTHSAGGITDNDFALAHKIEDVVLWRPEPGGPLEGTPNKFLNSKK